MNLREKKKLNITFINPNTEEEIVQAMAGVIAYNLAEESNKIKFNYNESNKKKKIKERER